MDNQKSRLLKTLRFEPENGAIHLQGHRMVLLSAYALGSLRKELIDTLGWEAARGVLKRFGYAAGHADGLAMGAYHLRLSDELALESGPLLHALEGIVRVESIPGTTAIDIQKGIFHMDAYWVNSYEAEQHLETHGRSETPVCWTLSGYATGYSTAIMGCETLVTEIECRAMGHARCRFVADLDRNFTSTHDRERDDYSSVHFPTVIDDMRAAIDEHQLSLQEKERLLEGLQSRLGEIQNFTGVIGACEPIKRVIHMARRVAAFDTTVLVFGESGTGKELIARGIENNSSRRGGPFVTVNCSALTESLQEAELFGFVKGAFTGATHDRKGLFESADGGTLFLDEIGDLIPSAQTKLMRALQEGEVKRIGENRVRRVDVRIIAATNKDLDEMIRIGTFREDLFYRLNTVTITVPPLCRRGNDVLLLARHFVERFAQKFDKRVKGLSSDAARALAAYSWPGNVRELEHAVERAVILASGTLVRPEDLPPAVSGRNVDDEPIPSTVPVVQDSLHVQNEQLSSIADESERIRHALELADGHRDLAAKMLGISRTTLWRRIKRWNASEVE